MKIKKIIIILLIINILMIGTMAEGIWESFKEKIGFNKTNENNNEKEQTNKTKEKMKENKNNDFQKIVDDFSILTNKLDILSSNYEKLSQKYEQLYYQNIELKNKIERLEDEIEAVDSRCDTFSQINELSSVNINVSDDNIKENNDIKERLTVVEKKLSPIIEDGIYTISEKETIFINNIGFRCELGLDNNKIVGTISLVIYNNNKPHNTKRIKIDSSSKDSIITKIEDNNYEIRFIEHIPIKVGESKKNNITTDILEHTIKIEIKNI
jgi:hypothetical protein